MNIGMNDDGDIDVSMGDLVLSDGIDETVQFVAQKLRTILGEWFLDVRLGLPYFDDILTKRPNPATIDALFQNEIITTPRILNLVSFDVNLEKATRKLMVSFEAESSDGPIVFEENVT